MKKNLYLIKMGNDFNKNDEIIKNSDLNNYRYFIHDITLKNNKNLDTLEISSGARYKYKNNKIYRNDCFGCWIQTYFYKENGDCIGLHEIDKKINLGNYQNDNYNNFYNKATILKIVNSISKYEYNNIVILNKEGDLYE